MDYIKEIIRAILEFFSPSDPVETQLDAAEKAFEMYTSAVSPDNMDRAVIAFDLALTTWLRETAKRHPFLPYTLVNHATVLWNKYSSLPTGDVNGRYEQLKQIISLDEQALALWREERPPGDAYRILLYNLANAYFDRASLGIKEGGNHFYDESLYFYRKVYNEEVPSNEYSPVRQANAALGIARVLWATYDKDLPQAHGMAQLDEMISKAGDAQVLRQDDVETKAKVECLVLLAEGYGARSRISKKDDDLSKAVLYNRDALGLLKQGDPGRAPPQYNLAFELLHRYNLYKDVNDLRQARKVAEEGRAEASDQAFLDKFDDILNRTASGDGV